MAKEVKNLIEKYPLEVKELLSNEIKEKSNAE